MNNRREGDKTVGDTDHAPVVVDITATQEGDCPLSPRGVSNNCHVNTGGEDDLIPDVATEPSISCGGNSVSAEDNKDDIKSHYTPLETTLQPEDKVEDAAGPGAGVVVRGGNVACVHDSQGMCDVHGQAQKKLRPRKVWTKGKNGLFGWRYARTTYYECRTVTKAEDDDTPRPTFVTMKSSSTISKLKPKNNLIASSNRCMGKGSSDVVDEK